MNLVARLRRVLARRPWLYWTGVLLLALGVAATVASATATVDEARRAWGDTRRVVVATDDLVPGDLLAGVVDIDPRRHPVAVDLTGAARR